MTAFLFNNRRMTTEAQRNSYSPQRHRDTEYFSGVHWNSFSRELQLIVSLGIWFRSCWSELLYKSHPCDLPFGSASQHKFIPNEFVFTRIKKVTKEIRPGRSCFACPQPASLPTGRLDSPSGLDKTRLTVPGQSTLPVKLSSASLTGTRSFSR